MARATSSMALLAMGLLLMTIAGQCYGQLKVGYYNNKCGTANVEAIIFDIVKKHFLQDPDTVADLIRLHFHDCFVRGCDASILLEGSDTEKTAPPNASVDGFAIIEEAKVACDKHCPGVVSCADIVALAARSAAFLGGAKWYYAETGRKDGVISKASDALRDLPSPRIPVSSAIQLFAKWGLNKEDFVLLLGCHTVGTAHCLNFQDRLWNFNGTGRSDPLMAKSLLWNLQQLCPRNTNSTNEAYLDQTPGSQFKMDNGFYKAIVEGKGVLQVDQRMAFDPETKYIVKSLADNPYLFPSKIGNAMIKMGRIGVITTGQVRSGTCRYVNHY